MKGHPAAGREPPPAAGWGARGGTKPGRPPGQAPEGGTRRPGKPKREPDDRGRSGGAEPAPDKHRKGPTDRPGGRRAGATAGGGPEGPPEPGGPARGRRGPQRGPDGPPRWAGRPDRAAYRRGPSADPGGASTGQRGGGGGPGGGPNRAGGGPPMPPRPHQAVKQKKAPPDGRTGPKPGKHCGSRAGPLVLGINLIQMSLIHAKGAPGEAPGGRRLSTIHAKKAGQSRLTVVH